MRSVSRGDTVVSAGVTAAETAGDFYVSDGVTAEVQLPGDALGYVVARVALPIELDRAL